MQITLDIPDCFVNQQNQTQITAQIKLYTALLMFQSEQLSRGAACVVPMWIFTNFCKPANSIISA